MTWRNDRRDFAHAQRIARQRRSFWHDLKRWMPRLVIDSEGWLP